MNSQLIANEIDRFRVARSKLVNAIVPSTKEGAEQVISFAYEFGVDAAVQQGMNANNPMGVTAPRQNAPALAQILRSIIAITDRLDWLVSESNEAAVANNPAHKRVFMHFDRKFTIDAEKGTITYLDDPLNPQPIQLSAVPTNNQPGPRRLTALRQTI